MFARSREEVRAELNEQTRRLLVSRCRAGLVALLLSDLLFAAGDLGLAGSRSTPLLCLKAIQLGFVAFGFMALRRLRPVESVIALALFVAGTNCVLGAGVNVIRGNLAVLPLTNIVLTMATATLLPWGPWPQLVLTSIAGTSVLWASYEITGGLGAVLDYPGIAMVIAFLVSVFVAFEFDRYRMQIEQRNLELRAYRDVVENANDAILTLDRERKITGANPAARQMFGYSEAELAGRWVGMLLTEADARTLDEHWPRIVAGRETIISLDAVRKDGGLVPIEVKGRRLGAEGLQTVLRDVTEKRVVEQMRNDFIAMLSHDMKTPLGSILGFAEMLSDRLGGATDVRQIVDRIEANARMAHSLAVNFVDVARIESGSLELQLESTSLNEIVDQVLRHQESMARAREISLEAMLARDLPRLPLDPRHIDRVVANLISNAIKFSPAHGHVRVGTACENGRVVLAVRDQGPGIPPDERSHLFERFRRIGNPRVDGSGLGLYIVKQIVEAHGGRVRVDCPAGGGSLFEVSFEERPLAA